MKIILSTLVLFACQFAFSQGFSMRDTAFVGNAVPGVAGGGTPAFESEVQRGSIAEDSATTTITLTGGVAAGHRAVLAISATMGSITSVSDSKGNTWTIMAESTDTYIVAAIASCHVETALVADDTITVTWPSASYLGKAWAIFDLSGCASTGQPDQVSETAGYGTAVSSAATTTTDDTVIIGLLFGDNETATYGSGAWTSVGSLHVIGDRISQYVRITLSSAGSQNPSGSWSTTMGHVEAWAAFK